MNTLASTLTHAEMGSKVSRATQTEDMGEKKFFIPTEVCVRYTLEFEAQVERTEEHKDVRYKHVDEVRAELQHSSTWREFLGWTMRDAVVNHFEKETGQEIHCGANEKGPVENLSIVLDPRRRKSHFDEEYHTYVTGCVSWDSIDTEPASYASAVQWRLGDRMAYHGVQDIKSKWCCSIHFGKSTKVPAKASE